MAKYEVEYAQFTKVEIEAESFQEARDIAATLDDEEITKKGSARIHRMGC